MFRRLLVGPADRLAAGLGTCRVEDGAGLGDSVDAVGSEDGAESLAFGKYDPPACSGGRSARGEAASLPARRAGLADAG